MESYAHKCNTHPRPPTSKMDPTRCIAPCLIYTPKWRVLIVMVPRVVPYNGILDYASNSTWKKKEKNPFNRKTLTTLYVWKTPF